MNRLIVRTRAREWALKWDKSLWNLKDRSVVVLQDAGQILKPLENSQYQLCVFYLFVGSCIFDPLWNLTSSAHCEILRLRIWQAVPLHCYRGICKISKKSKNITHRSSTFDVLRHYKVKSNKKIKFISTLVQIQQYITNNITRYLEKENQRSNGYIAVSQKIKTK